MKRKRINGLLLCLALCVGCGKTAEFGTEGNTSWLPCTTDAECEDACRCGFCTRECESHADCAGLGGTAICATVVQSGAECEVVPESQADLAVCVEPCSGSGCALETGSSDSPDAGTADFDARQPMASPDAGNAMPSRDAAPRAPDAPSTAPPTRTPDTDAAETVTRDENFCLGLTTEYEPSPSQLLILLDQSTSMADPFPGSSTSKWDAVTAALASFVEDPSIRDLEVGLQYFGLPDRCNEAAYANPEVAVGPTSDVRSNFTASLAEHGPTTLTPTYPALAGTLSYMAELASEPERLPSAVVLISDGFPTQCDETGDPASGASIAAVAELARGFADATPPVFTYVVAVGEGLVNSSAIARAGGTRQAVVIDSGDVQEQLVRALDSFRLQHVGCDFGLPENSAVDYGRIWIELESPVTGQAEVLRRVDGPNSCTGGFDEWYLAETETAPHQVTLCPETCRQPVQGVNVEASCLADAGAL